MKAVMVFCEGMHDVVFVRRSLEACGGYSTINKPVRELPSPFGVGATARKGFISMHFDRQDIEDLKIDSEYPRTPKFESFIESRPGDPVFVLIRAGGNTKAKRVIDLLQHLDVVLDSDEYDITEYAAAFLFDANARGLVETLEAFRQDYGTYFGDLLQVEHARWISTATIPVGVFVFHRSPQEETGTLEDHLAPMIRSWTPNRYADAKAFIENKRESSDAVSRNEAKRQKAIFTATGQFNHPGDSLSVILRDGLPTEQFTASPMSKAVVEFLENAP